MENLFKLYKRILRDWPHILAVWASVEIVIKFHSIIPPDYSGFIIAIGGVVTIMTGKHYWDIKADAVAISNPDPDTSKVPKGDL